MFSLIAHTTWTAGRATLDFWEGREKRDRVEGRLRVVAVDAAVAACEKSKRRGRPTVLVVVRVVLAAVREPYRPAEAS
jgi:hypothetical protein